MKFIELILWAAAITTVVAAPSNSPASINKKRKSKFTFTGINESGAEFGNGALPGQLNKDYTWPAHSTIDVGSQSAMGIL